jgi:hypothetical protein
VVNGSNVPATGSLESRMLMVHFYLYFISFVNQVDRPMMRLTIVACDAIHLGSEFHLFQKRSIFPLFGTLVSNIARVILWAQGLALFDFALGYSLTWIRRELKPYKEPRSMDQPLHSCSTSLGVSGEMPG